MERLHKIDVVVYLSSVKFSRTNATSALLIIIFIESVKE
jgi:hypothetical protein